jgi:phage baseplate assembly protein W
MITQAEKSAITGTGIAYPITFSVNGQAELLSLTTGSALINQSIHTILATRVGERYNNIEFGSKIPELLFEPYDNITKDVAYYYATTALKRWERRVSINGVKFVVDTTDDSFMGIWIGYIELETGNTGSYVFPFTTSGEGMSTLNIGNVTLG